MRQEGRAGLTSDQSDQKSLDTARYAKTTHGRYAQPSKRDLEHLGPILPACPACGEMRYWHNHATDVWECWTCVPPRLRSYAGGQAA
jgi:ribosomal protein L37AE/L43A